MENYPKPVTKQCLNKILEQMNNSMYKIIRKDGNFDVGYFTIFKNQENNIPVVIINIYQSDEEYNNYITILKNNHREKIQLGKKRYKNEDLNILIIEIKVNEINKINYLEIDDKIFDEEYEIKNSNESIYIIQYDYKNNASVSFGIIKYIDFKKFRYSCNLNSKSKCYIVFNSSNNKIIGIHNKISKYSNKGILFNYIINEFIKINTDNKNEIIIHFDIQMEEINKDIYFLDNYYEDKEGLKSQHNNFNELNEFNTELYINNIKHKFQKYFKPLKDGKNVIKLKFNINLTNCSYMFSGCKNITKIYFISFNTNNITDMKYMFYKCINLKEVNLLSFNTLNVTDMSYMFSYCSKLDIIDLTSFNTKNVTDMSSIFYGLNEKINLAISHIDIQNVKEPKNIFNYCNNSNPNLYLEDINNISKDQTMTSNNEIIFGKYEIFLKNEILINEKGESISTYFSYFGSS